MGYIADIIIVFLFADVGLSTLIGMHYGNIMLQIV